MQDLESQLVGPVGNGAARRSSSRTAWFAATSALLLCCALIAVSTLDGSSETVRASLEEESPGVVDPNAPAEEITSDDMAAAEAEAKAELNAMPTTQAGSIRGSKPTFDAEATSIIDGSNYVKHMGEPFWAVTGPHSDDAAEADSIIDIANHDNMDITGKAGATLYAAAADPKAPAAAWMRGSIPNYRAESQYILSGVFGNYEKSLENMPTMAVVSGKLPARTVAYTIIDEAYKDKTSPDCTGSVDKDGVHGVGKGTPPCTALLKFNKPKVDVAAEVEAEAEAGEAEAEASAEGEGETT